MSIHNRWQSWRCHRGHHKWTRAHRAIWNGGYVRCNSCGERDVQGGDQYGPAATAWVARGIAPPADGWMFSATDWRAWNERVRRGGDDQ